MVPLSYPRAPVKGGMAGPSPLSQEGAPYSSGSVPWLPVWLPSPSIHFSLSALIFHTSRSAVLFPEKGHKYPESTASPSITTRRKAAEHSVQHSCFIGKETKSQRTHITCPESPSKDKSPSILAPSTLLHYTANLRGTSSPPLGYRPSSSKNISEG